MSPRWRGILADVLRSHLFALGAVLAACSGTKSTDAPRTTEPPPPQPAVVIDAPTGGSMTAPDLSATSQALEPKDALVAWLDRNGGPRDIGGQATLKLPVAVTMDADRLGITGATLGALAVKLDDTALGIALKDRVRQKCPPDATTCRVWLEGTWRGVSGDVGQIQVTRFVGAIAAGDAGDRVEIKP